MVPESPDENHSGRFSVLPRTPFLSCDKIEHFLLMTTCGKILLGLFFIATVGAVVVLFAFGEAQLKPSAHNFWLAVLAWLVIVLWLTFLVLRLPMLQVSHLDKESAKDR